MPDNQCKPLPNLAPAEIARFWKKVNKTDTCWLWTGCNFRRGYGVFAVHVKKGAPGRNLKAHRVSYMLHFSVDPGMYLVMHKCDVPACVNPEHLRLGTNAENGADMKIKGRSLSGARNPTMKRLDSIPLGNDSPACKITDAQIRQIREIYVRGVTRQVDLAFQFGVTQTTISSVMLGGSKRLKRMGLEDQDRPRRKRSPRRPA